VSGHVVSVVGATARPTAVVARATTWGEFPSLWGALLGQVYEFLRTSDVRQRGHNVMLYRDDVPHVEVGVEVDRAFDAAAEVVPSHLPAGPAAMTVHRGPYDQLGAAHTAVHEWCAANGHPLTRTRWEVYGDHHDDPAQLETEVWWLLA
jgi:effector-binding domain-containing protein